MRTLIFHGYLLRGTGSNVYNAKLAEALAALGHEVHLFSQDRSPEELPVVDAVGDWDGGALAVRVLREPVRCTVYRPPIGDLLPVYVADRYPGVQARTFADCSDAEVVAYVEVNVAAVAEVARRVAPEVALANHAVMGPAILARALGPLGVPFAAKIHGSALEYTVKREPERFVPFALEGLRAARGVLVGSRHTAQALWATLGDDDARRKTRLGPPGVDVDQFHPREPADAAAALRSRARRLRDAPAATASSAFDRDEAAVGRALARLDPSHDRLVAFVGKLMAAKGVDLIAAAWPLVLGEVADARLVVVGFGSYRPSLERLLAALAAGDLAAARLVAREGRTVEGGSPEPLRHLLAFLHSLEGGERDAYVAAARTLPERVVLTGRLDHGELADLLACCEAQVVPSTFPEAFGMVAAEAAASGVLPVSAAHSGLAEVTRELAAALPAAARDWLSFEVGPGAVRDLAAALTGWLTAPAPLRATVRAALAAAARERYSWTSVAATVIHAGRGELDVLPRP